MVTGLAYGMHPRESKFDLSPDRIARLEAMPNWTWDAMSDKWEEGFCHLKEFIDLEGHAKITAEHITPDGYRLGGWISKPTSRKRQSVNQSVNYD